MALRNLSLFFVGVLALASAMTVGSAVGGEIPAAAKERGFFLLPEFHDYKPDEAILMEDFLKIVQSPAVSVSVYLRP